MAQGHATIIDELVGYGFQPFGLGQSSVQQLKEIAVFAVVKDLFLEDVTGLVFAGFGTEDRYPVCVTWLLSAVVGGIVKRGQASVDVIDTEVRSKIRMFADSEVTHAFIRGIDFGWSGEVYGAMRMMLHSLVDQVVGAFPGADSVQREEVCCTAWSTRWSGAFPGADSVQREEVRKTLPIRPGAAISGCIPRP